MKIKGVIFDMDGTLVDVSYDWQRIRQQLQTDGKPILAHLQDLEEPERTVKWKRLEEFELEATLKARLKKDVPGLLTYLTRAGIKKALVTNNSLKNVRYLLNKFHLRFDCVLTRENGLWKPSGRPFLTVLERLHLRKEECCVVGDSPFDVLAAAEAGIAHIFILSGDKDRFNSTRVQLCSSVKEVQKKIMSLS